MASTIGLCRSDSPWGEELQRGGCAARASKTRGGKRPAAGATAVGSSDARLYKGTRAWHARSIAFTSKHLRHEPGVRQLQQAHTRARTHAAMRTSRPEATPSRAKPLAERVVRVRPRGAVRQRSPHRHRIRAVQGGLSVLLGHTCNAADLDLQAAVVEVHGGHLPRAQLTGDDLFRESADDVPLEPPSQRP